MLTMDGMPDDGVTSCELGRVKWARGGDPFSGKEPDGSML